MKKYYGQIIKLKAEKFELYKKLHSNIPKEVNEIIKQCNIQNYSIFHRDGFLFGYFEYIGDDFENDMKKMSENKIIQKWWEQTDPCQNPIDTASNGEWWVNMEEIYHLD